MEVAAWNWGLNQSCDVSSPYNGITRKLTREGNPENNYRTEPWVLKAVCLIMKAMILSVAKNIKVGQAIGDQF